MPFDERKKDLIIGIVSKTIKVELNYSFKTRMPYWEAAQNVTESYNSLKSIGFSKGTL